MARRPQCLSAETRPPPPLPPPLHPPQPVTTCCRGHCSKTRSSPTFFERINFRSLISRHTSAARRTSTSRTGAGDCDLARDRLTIKERRGNQFCSLSPVQLAAAKRVRSILLFPATLQAARDSQFAFHTRQHGLVVGGNYKCFAGGG